MLVDAVGRALDAETEKLTRELALKGNGGGGR
jgi:hypothetical protein